MAFYHAKNLASHGGVVIVVDVDIILTVAPWERSYNFAGKVQNRGNRKKK